MQEVSIQYQYDKTRIFADFNTDFQSKKFHEYTGISLENDATFFMISQVTTLF